MARIRTIKPEFFTSASIVELTPLSRLFYISLWCEADREGRLNWNLKTLKMRYLPADDCNIEDLANELIAANLIYIYQVDGRQYAEIPSFAHHQVINNRESDSVIPEKHDFFDASFTRESGVQGEGKEGRKGKERNGNGVASNNLSKSQMMEMKPIEVSSDVWEEYLDIRSRKKAGKTKRAMDGILRDLDECKKNGVGMESMIVMCIENEWKGVDFRWYLNKIGQGAQQQKQQQQKQSPMRDL